MGFFVVVAYPNGKCLPTLKTSPYSTVLHRMSLRSPFEQTIPVQANRAHTKWQNCECLAIK